MENKKEETARFATITDGGDRHTIIEYTTMILHRPVDGPEQWVRGPKSYSTDSGKPVNRLDDGAFKLVLTDQVARPT